MNVCMSYVPGVVPHSAADFRSERTATMSGAEEEDGFRGDESFTERQGITS